MVIQIDGSGSVNKGAELMLAACLQEIKRSLPDSQVIINSRTPDEEFVREQYGNNYVISRDETFYTRVEKYHIVGILSRFSRAWANYFTLQHAVKGVDLILDVGGFQFGDQWGHIKDGIDSWKEYLKRAHKYGTKVVFMPQAFGPFEKEGSKKMLKVLNDYSDLLIARDDVSYNYLLKEGASIDKVLLYPDFTSSVEPQESNYSKKSNGKVCIIPNSKIVQMGTMEKKEYINAIVNIIDLVYKKGKEVILLNHEGEGDYKLCNEIAGQTTHHVEVISGLNAVKTKGVISTSYMIISSRFHGVANSLSCGVPCLATSWSHKYKKLLEEYGQDDCLLDLIDQNSVIDKINKMLISEKNKEVRFTLGKKNVEVRSKNREMWDEIWKRYSKSSL